MTDAPKDIDEALLALQLMNLTVKKTAEGAVRAGKADKYADLGEFNRVILTALNGMGVIWTCLPTMRGDNFVLAYSLKHVPSGTAKEGDFPLPKTEPQKIGSAITYSRRQALGAVTGVAAEGDDDDGNGYRGRQGMAQRASVRQERAQPAAPTAQRAAPAPRSERARPAQQPPLPERPASPAPGTDEPMRGRGGLITIPMTKKLAITMQEVIGNDVSLRKQFITDMIGREVATSKDLTFEEGRGLIDAFEKAKATEVPEASVIEIYQRTTGQGAGGRPEADKAAEVHSIRDQTRDAVVGAGDYGTEQAPWEDGALPV